MSGPSAPHQQQVLNLHRFRDADPEHLEPPAPLEQQQYKRKDSCFPAYTQELHDSHRPIVIDMGTYGYRVGWSGEMDPQLIFSPLVGRIRGGVQARTSTKVGNDLTPQDFQRLYVRSPFEHGEALINLELQEKILDYVFSNMAINGSGSVNHPLVLTECVANPAYCRQQLQELLFECYGVPSVVQGIDALFSHHYHRTKNSDSKDQAALIVRSGNCASHVMPVVAGTGLDAQRCLRLNLGGHHATEYATKLMSLKYPQHQKLITMDKAEQLKEEHCRVAAESVSGYTEELQQLASDAEYWQQETVSFQLPYVSSQQQLQQQQQAAAEVTPEQHALEEERKRTLSERMKRLAAERRVQERQEQESQLAELQELKQLSTTDVQKYEQYKKQYGYENDAEIDETIAFLKKKFKRAEQRERELQRKQEKLEQQQQSIVSSTSDLASAEPQDQSGAVAKAAAGVPKIEKDETDSRPNKKRKRHIDSLEQLIADVTQLFDENEAAESSAEADDNPQLLLQQLKDERIKLLNRISQMKQQRMREEETGAKSKRRTAGAKKRLKAMAQALDDEADDTFGIEDEDWDLYASINDQDAAYSVDVEVLKKQEMQSEQLLIQVDTLVAKLEQKLFGSSSTLAKDKPEPTHYIDQFKRYSEEESMLLAEEERNRMHFTVERLRIPDIFFQPQALCGIEQMGLAEMMNTVVKMYDHDPHMQQQLCNNVYVCGGNAMQRGMVERLRSELRAVRPVNQQVRVMSQLSPLDAWRGASLFSSNPVLMQQACMTRQMYEEYGGDYLQEHACSNRRCLHLLPAGMNFTTSSTMI